MQRDFRMLQVLSGEGKHAGPSECGRQL
ncbi:hypothetical protein EYF80_066231 [Liparis tanakae]|uniref:Uncharacterized protein n=1 Tax=Liparis tanakae TaxID=230148 RepID=A0A4Z2E4H9_9TELE|nr:hypothetical protein EYF80_066231 [Liparis tanakae]